MRIFTDDGDAVPVTVLDVSNNRVTQVKTAETDGYSAVQVAFGARKASRVTKPEAGHLAKAGVEAGEILQGIPRRRRTSPPNTSRARTVPVGVFAVGQKVDVQGTSIGKGFAGTIKRHNFSSQRASHGNSRSHNVPGSISMAQDPGRVFPGKKMSGHLGDVTAPPRTSTSSASTKRASCCWCAARCRARRTATWSCVRPSRRCQGRAPRREPTDATRAPERTRPGDVEGRRARHRVRPRLQRSAGAPDRRRLPGQRAPGHARAERPRRWSSTRPRSRGARRAPAALAPA